MRTLVILVLLLLSQLWAPAGEAQGRAPKAPGRRALAKVARSSQSSQYRHYRKLIAAIRGQVEEAPGERTVIALRGVDLEGALHPEGKRQVRAYTDTYVVIWRDERGKGQVRHFKGSTTPGQAATKYSGTPDADQDGVKDIAHLAPGEFVYKARKYKGKSAYGHGKRVPCYRDTNHDGRIDVAEKEASTRRGDTADGILFHRGLERRPSSVGCQTMKPAVFEAFEEALGGDKTWTYFLIDVRVPLRSFWKNPT